MTTEWEYATLLISEPSKLDAAVAELQQRPAKCRQKQFWAHERVAGALRFQCPTPTGSFQAGNMLCGDGKLGVDLTRNKRGGGQ